MSQRSIEIVIGKLVTDEAFLRDPQQTLDGVVASELALTALEVRALMGTHAGLWTRVADELDPRLQKAALGS